MSQTGAVTHLRATGLLLSILIPMLLLPARAAEAQEDDPALEIMEKHAARMAARNEHYEILLTIVDSKGKKEECAIAGVSRTRQDGQRKTLFVFLAPEAVKDAEILIIQNPSRENEVQYTLSPGTDDVTTLTGATLRNAFADSAFTYRDIMLEQQASEHSGYRIVKDEDIDGVTHHVLDAFPVSRSEKDERECSRRRLWIRSDNHLITRIEHYDGNNTPVRTLVCSRLETAKPAGAPRYTVFTMTTANGSKTVLEYETIIVNGEQPDEQDFILTAEAATKSVGEMLPGPSPVDPQIPEWGSIEFGEIVEFRQSPVTRFLSENITLSGHYHVRFYRDIEKDNDTENYNEFRNNARLKTETILNDSTKLILSIDARFDVDQNEGGLWRTEEDDLDLWEAYVKYQAPHVDVWVGSQVIRWGKSDELNPTDNFTPEDFSEMMTLDRVERKIPVPMARTSCYLGDFTLQAIYLPYFVPAPNTPAESDWVMPILRTYSAMGLTIDRNTPDKNTKNSVYAAKVIYRGPTFDVGASFASHYNQIPALRVLPPFVVYAYEKQQSYGVEFETLLKNVGLRGEAVYTTDDLLATNDPLDADAVTERDRLTFIIGADYTFVNDIYLNMQYFAQLTDDYSSDIAGEEYSQSIIGTFSRDFMREKLKLSLTGRYDFKPDGWFLAPEIEYQLNDFTTITLSVGLFGGDESSFFGQFGDNDQVGLEVKASF